MFLADIQMDASIINMLFGLMGGTGLFVVLFKLIFAREGKEYSRLDTRIAMLETALEKEQNARAECVRNLGIMEGKVTQLSTDLDFTIRRHDMKTEQQIGIWRKRVRELELYMVAQGLTIPPTDSDTPNMQIVDNTTPPSGS